MAHGVSVLLLGAPNAGKSTLANRLLRRERSIVADEAGTTRDLVEEATSFLGYPFRLVDAAGLREASDSVEQEGVRRATAAAKDAGIRLFVVDGSQPEWKASIFESDRRDSGALAVLTKRDLPHRLSVDEVEMALGVPVVEISDGDEGGLARLRAQILYRSPFAQPQAPPILTPFLDSHVRQLEESLKHLERGNFSEARDSLLSLVASGNQNRGENEPHEKGLHQHR
jgi:tRNA modification GTPase